MGVVVSQVLYRERSWNPLARTVELTDDGLRRGGRDMPSDELNLAAMAEAFRRGYWLGGGGTERPLGDLAAGPGVVPVTRVTGTTRPLKARRAAEFARALGEFAVRRCGGADEVAALAARARTEGVPLWIARRFAPGPAGPIAVAVERSLVRVDVWGPDAPVVRIRAPYGFRRAGHDRSHGLRLSVGGAPAEVGFRRRRESGDRVEISLSGRRWELRREDTKSSWLLRDDRRVALLTRPRRRRRPEPGGVLLPLGPVRYEGADPLDAVMAQAVAVAFGIGDTTGAARFRDERRRRSNGGDPVAADEWWERPWFSNLGKGRDDNEFGGADGWGTDGDGGGDGGDSGGGDGGGGDGGGGDGGGGGGGD
ncbi:hypothetical protein [Streptomyces sp. NPDC093094]|uniref:hypothetical protein n=1 Tax=Streptomyces sp. NPDC093094 TaxID=3366026 RepID=UPI003811B441